MKHILLFLIACLFVSISNACVCYFDTSSYPHFFQLAQEADLVIKVKVKTYNNFKKRGSLFGGEHYKLEWVPKAMTVEILEIIKGEEKKKTVKVWGDPGNLCRPYASEFEKNGIYYMALFKVDISRNPNNEKSHHYFINSCGETFVPVQNDTISGIINNPNAVEFKEEEILTKDENGNPYIIYSPKVDDEGKFKKEIQRMDDTLFRRKLRECLKNAT